MGPLYGTILATTVITVIKETTINTYTETPITTPVPAVPTIQTSGIAVRQQPPVSGRTAVTISVTAPNRESAWALFQETRSKLCTALGANAKVGNSLPRESSEEITKMLRTETEFTVSDNIEITFEPARIGDVIAAMLNLDLKFTTPTFVFDKLPKVTPELLGAAAALAKTNAAGVAAGVGAHLGRLVSINVGPPQLKTVYRPLTSVEPSFNKNWLASMVHTSRSMSVLDSWDFDEEQLATYDTEVQVSVEYEVIEDTVLGEVA